MKNIKIIFFFAVVGYFIYAGTRPPKFEFESYKEAIDYFDGRKFDDLVEDYGQPVKIVTQSQDEASAKWNTITVKGKPVTLQFDAIRYSYSSNITPYRVNSIYAY